MMNARSNRKTFAVIIAVLAMAWMFHGCGSDPYELPAPEAGAAIVINDGATTTTSATVTLKLHAEDADGVVGYYVSENSAKPAADSAGWEVVPAATVYEGTESSFALSSGGGEKTVYVWFKDSLGNISDVDSAKIMYKESTGGGY